MKRLLQQHLSRALAELTRQDKIPADVMLDPQIECGRDEKNGDFSSNIAMLLAKTLKTKPRDLAEAIVNAMPASDLLNKVEIAGPGFINFFCRPEAFQPIVKDILSASIQYGRSQVFAGKRVHIEYVSSNPTGPLHVGHGRGAAYGASVANLLAAVGYHVHREYYVNDAGRQMDILATSVWLRYLQASGFELSFPRNGYQGDYIGDIAAQLQAQVGSSLTRSLDAIFMNVPSDLQVDGTGDKETHIDGIIANAKTVLGAEYQAVLQLGLQIILNDMREDLAEFGVVFDEWFSEQSLITTGASQRAFATLEKKGLLYEQDDAIWFRSTQFGDDKDRVIKRTNGSTTYFGNDIAYHYSKLERGYHLIIDVLGADHHGYTPRIRAVLQALTDTFELHVPLLQFVSLYRGSEKVMMSTRRGDFVTLRELREEVGTDATRFFYIMRRAEQPVDFDLELAKSKSNENPVYYIQYAHARVCSVLRQLTEKQIRWTIGQGLDKLHHLTLPEELAILKTLLRYPDVILSAAHAYEPHILVQYLRDLANEFHSYYNAHTFIVDDSEIREARLNLIVAIRQVIANGLNLLGITAPDKM